MFLTVILAGGKSSRFKSKKPKVAHELAGKTMLQRIVSTAGALRGQKETVIVHSPDNHHALLHALSPDDRDMVQWASQPESLGTGHALQTALPLCTRDYVLVLLGDVPCVPANALQRFVDATCDQKTLGVITIRLKNPHGYGRMCRHPKHGKVRIVEEANASEEEKRINQVNTGIWCLPLSFARACMHNVAKDPKQKEVYITELLTMWQDQSHAPAPMIWQASEEESPWFVGVNTRLQFHDMERRVFLHAAHELLEQGVRVDDAHRLECAGDVVVGQDTWIASDVRLEGTVEIGDGCVIEKGCVIKDSTIGDHVRICAHSVLEKSVVGAGSCVGPFAYLRKDTELADRVQVGCFVETKNTQMGEASKAKHLSYLGDLTIGKAVNIGAGVIHCNYNGREKFCSVIKDNVFIGADSQLIGPVVLHEKAKIAAGTTVTNHVESQALALSRVAMVQKKKRQPETV